MQKNETRAISKYIKMTPSKIRRILRQIEGKSYSEAIVRLLFMPYASCEPILKVLRSCTANAANNCGCVKKTLIIKAILSSHLYQIFSYRLTDHAQSCL